MNLSGTTAELDLKTILDAWTEATTRLERTHELLRAEVKRLTDELEVKNRELARKNRLADLGRMSSHVAHEVRNGLVPLRLYAGLLRRRLTDDAQGTGHLDKLTSGLTALEAVVQDLLQFAADRRPATRAVPLAPMFQEILEHLAPQCAAQRILCESPASDAVAWADADMLRRAVFNLALNAIDAMPNGGTLRLLAQADRDWCEAIVEDDGPGVSPALRQRVFEPFFTTKGTGTGLGLAIVSHVVELHAGQVILEDASPHGARFRLQFPSREAAARPSDADIEFPTLLASAAEDPV